MVQETAAKLYGQGLNRRQIAKLLVNHLVPNGRHRPLEQRLVSARMKLKGWEQSQTFRDMVWNLALVQLDMKSPQILEGVAKKATRGRVDAAKLALEITGRHNPRGEQQPTQVAVVFNGIPRPMEAQAVEATPPSLEAADVVQEDDDV